jgi:hypothetical protein
MPEDLKEKETFYDLIYEDRLAQVKAAFPDFTVEDASDEIHEERVSVSGPDERFDEYLLWLLRTGLARASFWIGLTIRCPKGPAQERLRKVFDRFEAEKKAKENPGTLKGP